MKNHILNWYNFRENSNILEVKEDLDFNSITEKYDYVIFNDLYKIGNIKNILKENGTAILVVDNKFSISYFAGSKPKFGNVYSTIIKDDNRTFSKNQIEKELNIQNLNYRFYYLLPNYEKPDVIFSDDYLPTENSTKLIYHLSYLPGSAVVFDELNALKQITKDGQFTNFANSYIVEIGNLAKNEPRFISFNNYRKEEYQLITKIYEKRVEKIPFSNLAENHLVQIWENTEKLRELGFEVIEKKENELIVSEFIHLDTLDKIISKKIINNQIQDAITIINNWYNNLKSKLPISEENGLNFTKYGYIDLVFENTFINDNKFLFFDQEWFLENIPIELILYRAIKNLYTYNCEMNEIYPFEKMLNHFKLLDYLEKFEKIEKDFQDNIIDNKKVVEHQNSLNMLVDVQELSLLNDYKENNNKQNILIQSIQEDNNNKQHYIEYLEQQNEILKQNQRKFFRRK